MPQRGGSLEAETVNPVQRFRTLRPRPPAAMSRPNEPNGDRRVRPRRSVDAAVVVDLHLGQVVAHETDPFLVVVDERRRPLATRSAGFGALSRIESVRN